MLGAMKNNAIFVVHLIFQICLAKLPWEGREMRWEEQMKMQTCRQF